MIKERVLGAFASPRLRAFAAILAVAWLLLALLFYASYEAAYRHLETNPPTELQNRSELQVYFAPVTISAADRLTPRELTEYLDALGYDRAAADVPGSYSVRDKAVAFSPRLQTFLPAKIAFSGNSVSSIIANGRSVETLELEPLPMRSFIKFVNDRSLREQRVRRVVLAPDAVPPMLADAVTSAEDSRFFQHSGLDVFGIAKRVLTLRGGGSSITQQLIKGNIAKGANDEFWQRYLSFLPETAQRKAMEVPFALAAEEMLGKERILAAYLSMVPLAASEGVELVGVVSAVQEYFGKPVSDLTLAECATVAGLIHRPSYYLAQARRGDYVELVARRNRVLDAIARNHPEKYGAAQIDAAKRQELKFVFASTKRTERPADAFSRLFSAYAANHLPDAIEQLRDDEGSLQVFTTLDFRLQKAATEVCERAASKLSGSVRQECRAQGREGVDCGNLRPQIALVAMNPRNGAIVAMYGGLSTELNFALARRSPASAVKPFYYLAAVQQGQWNGARFTPETIIDPATDRVGFRPDENVGRRSTAAVGLARSYNFHAVAAAESVGIENAVEFVGRITNSTPEPNGMSAIGGTAGSETGLLDLVRAYAVFAADGVRPQPKTIESFVKDGRRVSFADSEGGRFTTAENARIVKAMLRGVVAPGGTAPDFKRLAGLANDADIAAKTGTGMVADMLFVVVNGDDLVVGVWAGLPDNEIQLPMDKGFSSGKVAVPIAAEFIRRIEIRKPDYAD